MAFNEKWNEQSDITLPSSREVSRLLDEKNTPILVLNGNNDIIVYATVPVNCEPLEKLTLTKILETPKASSGS